MRPRTTNAHPADIYAQVRKRGGNWAAIARAHGLHRSTVAAAPLRPQPAGNRAIAAFLGTTVHSLWPEWFDRDGARRSARKSNAINTARGGHCQNGRAA